MLQSVLGVYAFAVLLPSFNMLQCSLIAFGEGEGERQCVRVSKVENESCLVIEGLTVSFSFSSLVCLHPAHRDRCIYRITLEYLYNPA